MFSFAYQTPVFSMLSLNLDGCRVGPLFMGWRFLGVVDDVFGELSSRKILPNFVTLLVFKNN
jgi:hypothetical protein